MRQTYRSMGYLAGLAFLLVGVSHGQSLGCVARQQRQNEQLKKDQPAPKVITNEDLPEHAEEASDSEKAQLSHSSPRKSSKSPAQWKSEIEAQERSIAALQNQMAKLNSSIRFATVGSSYYAAQRNERQEQKQEQVQHMQEQLAQQRQRLEDLQEAARKDGYGNAVWEP
jgi:predicted RNase H-like nuclease (RuvC/YqgF family)